MVVVSMKLSEAHSKPDIALTSPFHCCSALQTGGGVCQGRRWVRGGGGCQDRRWVEGGGITFIDHVPMG